MNFSKYLIVIILLATCHWSFGQDATFYVEAPDTVAIGKPFKVTFTLENAKGEIDVPEFFGLKVVGGPNQSTSVSIVNGDMTQTMSISYSLLAEEEGQWVIERATVEIEGTYIETVPTTIVSNMTGPLNPPKMDKEDDWFGGFTFRDKIVPIKPDKPKLSKKDSILKKYKTKKF